MGCMLMAQRHGQRIGCIILYGFVDAEQQSYHVLNLCLVGATPAHNGLFDQPWTIVEYRYVTGYGGTNSRTACLAELDGRCRIMGDKYGFDGSLVGLEFCDQLFQPGKNNAQSLGELTVTGFDYTIIHRIYAIATDFNDACTGQP